MSGDETGRDGREEADRRILQGYLDGREGGFALVDGWIRREIDLRYSSLRSEREDLSQQVHERLLANLRGGRFRHGSALRTYVLGIVHHTCIDALRRRYQQRPEEVPEDAPASWGDPYHAMEGLDRRRILHLVFQRSPEACRRLWRMIFFDKLGYGEIAARLGVPEGTVKSRTFMCRRKALEIFRKLTSGS